jgi:hypothetical protein
MVSRRFAALASVAAHSALAGCGSFADPNVVLDLRVLAMSSEPPDQVIDVDLSQPVTPASVLSQLVPTEVCTLMADPGLDRRLLYTLTLCPTSGDDRCDDDRPKVTLGTGLVDDPDTAVPEPRLCVTIQPDANLVSVLLDVLDGDTLRGLGGVYYAVQLRIGGEDGDRDLDQYASKALRVSPRIPSSLTANTNPTIDHIDVTIDDGPAVALPLGRCAENLAPMEIAPGRKIRLTPVEPAGSREVYTVPTLDGKSQTFTESLTYQWIAGAGGFSSGSTGGPHDLSGNPAPLFTDYRAPRIEDLEGPTNISLWIIQRDERLGVRWYESCLHVAP